MAQRVSYSSLRSLSPTLAIIKICSVQYKISMNLQALLHATVMVQTSVLQGDTHPFVATVCDAFIWVDFFQVYCFCVCLAFTSSPLVWEQNALSD